MTSQIPFTFDLISQFRDYEDRQVLQTIVGLAGVPLVHRVVEIEHPNDPEFVQLLAAQEQGTLAADFAQAFRHALIVADETRPRVVPGEAVEPADQVAGRADVG